MDYGWTRLFPWTRLPVPRKSSSQGLPLRLRGRTATFVRFKEDDRGCPLKGDCLCGDPRRVVAGTGIDLLRSQLLIPKGGHRVLETVHFQSISTSYGPRLHDIYIDSCKVESP